MEHAPRDREARAEAQDGEMKPLRCWLGLHFWDQKMLRRFVPVPGSQGAVGVTIHQERSASWESASMSWGVGSPPPKLLVPAPLV
jgi:hypothetical protein